MEENTDGMVRDLFQALEDARNGQLSPYWQAFFEEETVDVEAPQVKQLMEQLRREVKRTPQISDAEAKRLELQRQGNRLLYSYTGKSESTQMEIVYLPMEKHYTASVHIAPGETEAAEQMQQDLLRWADAQDETFAVQPWTEETQENFCCATLQEAVSRLLFVLESFGVDLSRKN
jgi:histidinol dehydrogenase